MNDDQIQQMLLNMYGTPYKGMANATPVNPKMIDPTMLAWQGLSGAPAPKPQASASQAQPQGQLPLTGYSISPGLSTAESDAAFQRVNQKVLDSRKQQEAGVADIDQLISQLEGAPLPTGLNAVDLTPFAIAVDALTGSNFAPKVGMLEKPETEQERKSKILGLKQLRQKSIADITDKDIELAKLAHQTAQQKEMWKYGLAKEGLKAGDVKNIPASAAEQLGDLKTQFAAAEDLYKDWSGKVGGTSSVGGYLQLRGGQYIPNTDLASYRDNLKQKAQMIGKALEGGKLTDVDYEKYIHFLPQAGDTTERAEQRIKLLMDEISKKRANLIESFGQAGYSVGGYSGLPKVKVGSDGEGPAIGAVEEGHRYKGGDPKDPNSWEKI
jgi:hypothetical protein